MDQEATMVEGGREVAEVEVGEEVVVEEEDHDTERDKRSSLRG